MFDVMIFFQKIYRKENSKIGERSQVYNGHHVEYKRLYAPRITHVDCMKHEIAFGNFCESKRR